MSIEADPAVEVSARADLGSACVWIAFGLAVAVGSWRMDRLENLHINKYEIPGLVPGLLGAAIVVLGIVLALRSVARGALRPGQAAAEAAPGERSYMALVLGAMLLYALVLVGHGLPFWLVTGAFITAFIFFFDRERQAALGRSTARQLLLAATCGVVTSAVVSLAFQEIFYVRLP
ncbi:MAG: tripartite tricarboxylate transporter TctB family protein [Burkholderiales bacterium]|nr:tripartite tricarboxylate transporter TctB family protein [Burkholderiales bacterium]